MVRDSQNYVLNNTAWCEGAQKRKPVTENLAADYIGKEISQGPAWFSVIFCACLAAPGIILWLHENRIRAVPLDGRVLFIIVLICSAANARKVVVSGYDGECEQKMDCQSCLYNGGICVWVFAQKMTSDYDYCGNFSRLQFRYGQSYLLYNMVWCNRIYEESRTILPGETEIAAVDENGMAFVTIPARAWVAIVLITLFAATGIAGAVFFWFRYNRLRLVQLDTQSRPGSAAGDIRLNSVRQRSTSAQSSFRQGSRRGSCRQLSPIGEVHRSGGSPRGANNQAVNQISHIVHSGNAQDMGTNTTGSMANFTQTIQPMPLLNSIPSLPPPTYNSFLKYPFAPVGMMTGQDAGLATLSRTSSKKSTSTSTSTLELNTLSGGKGSFSYGTQTTSFMGKDTVDGSKGTMKSWCYKADARKDDGDDDVCKLHGHTRYKGGAKCVDFMGDYTDMGASLC